MAWTYPDGAFDALCNEGRKGNLTLFLGAGVSAMSGMPTWETLLLSVYFEKVSQKKLEGLRPFPNYLFAIAEWYLKERRDPPELLARKLRQLFDDDSNGQEEFIRSIGKALYGPHYGDDDLSDGPDIRSNETLQSVFRLCKAQIGDRYAVRSVVTYNYDNLLELALEDDFLEPATTEKRLFQPIDTADTLESDALPIFHVHGYLPFSSPQNSSSTVVLSEQEYNAAASDPYAWPNLVQLREMSTSVGLMVGLSITDRNIRRLLDVLGRSPVRLKIYALMKRPQRPEPTDDEVDWINQRAIGLKDEYDRAGVKSRRMGHGQVFEAHSPGTKGVAVYQDEIRNILSEVDKLTEEQERKVLLSLGITPIWYDTHNEVPDIIKEIQHAI